MRGKKGSERRRTLCSFFTLDPIEMTPALEEVLPRRGTRATILGALVLMIAAVAALMTALDAHRAASLSDESYRVREMSMQLIWLSSEITANELLYLDTRSPEVEARLNATDDLARRLIDTMMELVKDPGQSQRLAALRDAFAARLSEARAVMAAGVNPSPGVSPDVDTPSAIALRTILADFRARNAERLERRRANYRNATWKQLAVMLVATFGIMLLSAASVRTALRHMREIAGSRTRLREANASLEEEVAARTRELSRVNQLFATSLAGSRITAFSQDRDLVYTWIHNPRFGLRADAVLGRTDDDVLPEKGRDEMIRAKRAAMASGQSVSIDVQSEENGQDVFFRLHVDPLYDNERMIGVVCAALDITEDRRTRVRMGLLTDELAVVLQRFDVALRGADIIIFTQDLERRLTFISQGWLATEARDLIGRRDEEFLPEDVLAKTLAMKREVLTTGEPRLGVFRLTDRSGHERWYRARFEALRDVKGGITGLMGCAVDVSTEKRAEAQLRHVSSELQTTVQLFETALRGADVIVFTQDHDLRYNWISAPIAGHPPEDMVGHTDEEIAPADIRARLVEFKRAVLKNGAPDQNEFRFPGPSEGGERWYALWAEPQRGGNGKVTGLVGALVDITERRQRETHIRVLMRELTHRTKNLLAVIQAMARQTLTAALSAKDFESRFSGRLQGLASSLDLLVQENWEGAGIEGLVRSQMAHDEDVIDSRIRLSGPDVKLTPEAAQNLGLALHELSTNASKYGALSVAQGHVDIEWGVGADESGVDRLRFRWAERDGPAVEPPRRKGFGHAVIERLVPRALSASVRYDFPPTGVIWEIDAPLGIVQSGPRTELPNPPFPPVSTHRAAL